MKKSLLLCPPTYYDIKYEINPWMSKDNPIDKARAMEQYETLTYAYEQLGVNYDELAPDESVPDQVFTTDTGHAENKKFIKANFKYDERKKEADIAEEDNALMVCNLMNIGGNAVLTQGISNTLKDALRPHVELISTTPMSEYIKG